MSLTLPQQLVLRILTRQLRAATGGQLACVVVRLGRIAAPQAGRVIASLQRRGLLRSCILPLAVPELAAPLANWRRGSPAPDFEAMAWAAEHRWATRRVARTHVFWASRRAVRLVGGVGGRLRKPLQLEHDLGVAAALVARVERDSQAAEDWLGEDLYVQSSALPRREKIPDAVELGTDGRPRLVLDYVSRYPARRLREFHDYWSARRVPHEWW